MLAVDVMMSVQLKRFLGSCAGLGLGVLATACASQANHSRLTASHGQLQALVSTVGDDLKRVDSRLLLLERSVAEQRRVLDAMSQRVAEQEPILHQLSEKFGSVSEMNERLIEDRSKLRASLSELEHELRSISSSKKAAEARAAEKQAVLDRFEAIVEALD